jgi:hypothetical protein
MFRGGEMQVKCDWCGVEFNKPLSRIKRSNGNFCNKEHWLLHHKTKPATCHPNKLSVSDGLCKTCYSRKYNKENPGPAYRRSLKHRFGITPEQRDEIISRQNGMCAICKIEKATHIDHCHKTGRIRGMLCLRCNAALGLLRENVSTLVGAVNYLDFWGKR